MRFIRARMGLGRGKSVALNMRASEDDDDSSTVVRSLKFLG